MQQQWWKMIIKMILEQHLISKLSCFRRNLTGWRDLIVRIRRPYSVPVLLMHFNQIDWIYETKWSQISLNHDFYFTHKEDFIFHSVTNWCILNLTHFIILSSRHFVNTSQGAWLIESLSVLNHEQCYNWALKSVIVKMRRVFKVEDQILQSLYWDCCHFLVKMENTFHVPEAAIILRVECYFWAMSLHFVLFLESCQWWGQWLMSSVTLMSPLLWYLSTCHNDQVQMDPDHWK